ncbi:transposase [bacterium]|nr:transposase [bacterium]
MPRGPRISYPDAIFHVLNRFVDRHPFFRTDDDYREFRDIFFEESKTFGVRIFAYDLLPNHFHFVLQTPSGDISRFLQRFLSRAAFRLNRRYGRVGHLFQGRSKTLLVEKEAYFACVMGYVLTNRVRAGLAKDVFSDKWNSVAEMLRRGPSRIARGPLWNYLFGVKFSEDEIWRAREWLRSIDPSANYKHFNDGHRGSFLSSPEFRRSVLDRQERRRNRGEGKKRKMDRRPKEWNWAMICKTARAVVEKREWQGIWKSRETAIRQLSWYVAFVGAGWSLRRILETSSEVKHLTISGISNAVHRIRKDKYRKSIADAMINIVQRGKV